VVLLLLVDDVGVLGVVLDPDPAASLRVLVGGLVPVVGQQRVLLVAPLRALAGRLLLGPRPLGGLLVNAVRHDGGHIGLVLLARLGRLLLLVLAPGRHLGLALADRRLDLRAAFLLRDDRHRHHRAGTTRATRAGGTGPSGSGARSTATGSAAGPWRYLGGQRL